MQTWTSVEQIHAKMEVHVLMAPIPSNANVTLVIQDGTAAKVL